MAKTSRLTGSEKKAKRFDLKASKEITKETLRDIKRQRPFTREARRELQKISKGEYAPTTDINELLDKYQQAGSGAEKMFEAQKANAIAEFEQKYQPEIRGQFGASAGQGSRSSALNQALAAAQGNLTRGLNADYEQLRNQLSRDVLGMSQQSTLQGLEARLRASGGLIGQNIQPQFTGLAPAPSYMDTNRGPSSTQQLIGSGIQAAGTAAGAYFGGPAGAAAGKAATTWGTNRLGLTQ